MTWKLDPAHSNVGFSAKHMVVSTVRGQFKTYTGDVTIDPTDFTKSVINGEVEAVSIDTGNTDRDNHLRTSDFLDVPNHPKLTFRSTKIAKKGDGEYVVTGDLTIRGVTKPVDFAVEFGGIAKNPWGQAVAALSAHATINRKDFGVNFNAPLEAGGVLVSDKIKIEIDAEASAA